MIFFGVMHVPSGKLMAVYVSANPEGCDAGDTSAYISPSDTEIPWMTRSYKTAIEVATMPPAWYNSGTEKPMNEYAGPQSEVVVFDVQVKPYGGK